MTSETHFLLKQTRMEEQKQIPKLYNGKWMTKRTGLEESNKKQYEALQIS